MIKVPTILKLIKVILNYGKSFSRRLDIIHKNDGNEVIIWFLKYFLGDDYCKIVVVAPSLS